MREAIKKYPWASSIITSIPIGYAIAFVSVYFFGEYGWTVFGIVPFFLGLIPSLLLKEIEGYTKGQSFKIGFATLGIFCATTLIFAIEGIICIIMASPLMMMFTYFGTLVGDYIIQLGDTNKKQVYSLLALPIVFMIVDLSIDTEKHLEVKTTIEIESPIEEVWKNIVEFSEIDKPDEWIFKTGIAYPINSKIVGKGVGAIRYCNFTTGSFVEPITKWEEPTLLKFDVEDQPTPMRELNPFWDVHPPHLDGYFQSKRGQFKLEQLENGIVRVEGTTWYNIHIHPVRYWDIWSKFILHKIHYRVLKHIKKESETKD